MSAPSSPSLIEAALIELRRQIETIVKEELRRDQLTGLANSLVLDDLILDAIDEGAAFWCAFVEVDQFKRINDRFGYDAADEFLRKIAERLERFSDYIGTEAVAVRAHGDEFYLFGRATLDQARFERSFIGLCGDIDCLVIKTEQGDMTGTVSVGWITSDDEFGAALTPRLVLARLEAAVAEAKHQGRNRAVRYSSDLQKRKRHSLRDDCGECATTFTLEVPIETPHGDDMWCPNCGARRSRPITPSVG